MCFAQPKTAFCPGGTYFPLEVWYLWVVSGHGLAAAASWWEMEILLPIIHALGKIKWVKMVRLLSGQIKRFITILLQCPFPCLNMEKIYDMHGRKLHRPCSGLICGWLMAISWCVTLSACRGWLLRCSDYFLYGDIGLFRPLLFRSLLLRATALGMG